MIWIELCPDWIMANDDKHSHCIREGHRWTVDIDVDSEKYHKLWASLRRLSQSIELDKSGRLPAIKISPQWTSSTMVARIRIILDTHFPEQ